MRVLELHHLYSSSNWVMSLRQAAQKAWKGTRGIRAQTIGQWQARSTQFRHAITNSRARVSFVLKLMAWRKRSDTRGVAARLLLSTMPKFLAPTITMTISTVEDAKRVHQELLNWSKYERTSTREVRPLFDPNGNAFPLSCKDFLHVSQNHAGILKYPLQLINHYYWQWVILILQGEIFYITSETLSTTRNQCAHHLIFFFRSLDESSMDSYTPLSQPIKIFYR